MKILICILVEVCSFLFVFYNLEIYIYIYIIRILTKFKINSQAAYEPIKRSSHNIVQVFFCFFFFLALTFAKIILLGFKLCKHI